MYSPTLSFACSDTTTILSFNLSISIFRNWWGNVDFVECEVYSTSRKRVLQTYSSESTFNRVPNDTFLNKGGKHVTPFLTPLRVERYVFRAYVVKKKKYASCRDSNVDRAASAASSSEMTFTRIHNKAVNWISKGAEIFYFSWQIFVAIKVFQFLKTLM